MKFENNEFERQKIDLDNNEFLHCKFIECQICFRAVGKISMAYCEYIGCEWVFEGAANETLQFMSNIYAMGGGSANLIESTFDNIRNGNMKPTEDKD